MPQTIVDKHWCWFTDYVFLYADWTINLAEGREVEVGTGLMIKGKPRGSIFKVRKHCNFRTFGAGAIHVRVIDGGGPCGVRIDQGKVKLITIYSDPSILD